MGSTVRPLRLVMPLYYLLVVIAGILSGFLFWDIYKVMNPEPLLIPEIKIQASLPMPVAVWSSWLDSAVSNPPTQAAPPAPKKEEGEPKRTIDVKVNLVGVFGGKRNGVAIMGINGQGHQVYIVGDQVQDDIALAEVRLNSILLKVEDVEREYAIPRPDSVIEEINDNLQTANQSQPSVIQPALPNRQNQLQRQQQPERQSVAQVTPTTRKKITSVKKQVQEKPLSALGLGDFKLTRSQGQLGVQVRSFKYKDVLVGLGLQLNDVIISVNGKSIQEVTKNPQLANSLLQLSRFDVVVIRNGRKISVPIQW